MSKLLNYEAILDGAGLCSWDWNLVTNQVRFDKRWCQSIGYDINELEHNFETWRKNVHPEDLPRALESIQEYTQGQSPFYENIHRLKHKSGQWIWVLARARFSSWDENDSPITLTGTHLDITEFIEQKNIADNLERIAHIGTWEYDLRTKSLSLSKEIRNILKLDPHEKLQLESIINLYAPLDREKIRSSIRVCSQGLNFKDVFEFFNTKGDHHWSITTGHPVYNAKNQIYKVQGTFQDISHIKNTLNSFDAIINSLDDLVFEVDGDMTILNVWAKNEALLFAPKSQLINQPISAFVPEKLFQKFSEKIEHSRHGDENPSLEYLHPFLAPHEKAVWFRAKFYWQKNIKSQQRYTIVVSDITKEVDARQELETQLQRLSSIIASSPGAVFQFVLDKKGNMSIPFVTDHVVKLAGYYPHELYHDIQILYALVPIEDQPHFFELISQSAQNLTHFEWEGPMYKKDQSIFWSKIKSHPVKQSDGSVIWHGVWLDITDEKLREDEISSHKKILEHNTKLATLGEMVASIGHEINNPLAIARAQLESLFENVQEESFNPQELTEKATKISQALKRVELIVSGLRVFSRADNKQQSIFNIIDKTDETLTMLKGIYAQEGAQVTFDFEGERSQYTILGNEGRIQQVIVNLLNNAKDANQENQQSIISVRLSIKNEHILMRIIDRGKGIPKELHDKIFQPFFTTKQVNKGTGIGLHICHEIIKEHQGQISFETDNLGTTFTVMIARQHLKNADLQTKAEVPFAGIIQSKLILIVEDEAELRDYIYNRLTKLGHSVLVAENGLMALNAVNEHKNKIDLIISDINMPELDGPKLLEKIRNNPEIEKQPKFVFCTGGTTIDLSSDKNHFYGQIDGYLYKPFTKNDILELIHKVFA